jgi:hypothetical protein
VVKEKKKEADSTVEAKPPKVKRDYLGGDLKLTTFAALTFKLPHKTLEVTARFPSLPSPRGDVRISTAARPLAGPCPPAMASVLRGDLDL